MKYGFTGTQKGMTLYQRKQLRKELGQPGITEFHHGDCEGADLEAHFIAVDCRIPLIVIHPPSDAKKRAFASLITNSHGCRIETRPEKPYLARNNDIVVETDKIAGAPDGDERIRSGTWSTIRLAERLGKPVKILNREKGVKPRRLG